MRIRSNVSGLRMEPSAARITSSVSSASCPGPFSRRYAVEVRNVQCHRQQDLQIDGTFLQSPGPPTRAGMSHLRGCETLEKETRGWPCLQHKRVSSRQLVQDSMSEARARSKERQRQDASVKRTCADWSCSQLMHGKDNATLPRVIDPLKDELAPLAWAAPIHKTLRLSCVPHRVAAGHELAKVVHDVAAGQPAVDRLVVEQATGVVAGNIQPEDAVHAAVVADQVAPQLHLLRPRAVHRLHGEGRREGVERRELVLGAAARRGSGWRGHDAATDALRSARHSTIHATQKEAVRLAGKRM